mmetsp:Transcript_21892/g.74239  ORF Transcript_21892/g.74239 Transcript_21892/m.74239 type:complete len:206 (-) Transcript_21892:1320-1937(-)
MAALLEGDQVAPPHVGNVQIHKPKLGCVAGREVVYGNDAVVQRAAALRNGGRRRDVERLENCGAPSQLPRVDEALAVEAELGRAERLWKLRGREPSQRERGTAGHCRFKLWRCRRRFPHFLSGPRRGRVLVGGLGVLDIVEETKVLDVALALELCRVTTPSRRHVCAEDGPRIANDRRRDGVVRGEKERVLEAQERYNRPFSSER